MDRRASDRKLCVSLSSAPEVTARRHTDHATICRFADCIFFRTDPRREKLICFSHGRPSPVDNFPRRGNFDRRWEKVYKGDNKRMVLQRSRICWTTFFFFSLFCAFYPSIGGRKYSFATKYRIDKFEENFGDLSADWYFEMRRVPLRHASFNRIHILIRRHCERGQMLVTICHCIRSFRLS